MVRDHFMVVRDFEPMWSRTFVLLCLTQFLGYAHNAVLTPTLPLYVTHLGGSAFVVGLVLAAFSVTSVLVRPLVGYWTDAWRDSGVQSTGTFLLGLSVLLWLVPLTKVVALGNAMRGIAWAGLNTGGYALLAAITPYTRRGEASGYYGGIQSSASIIFPYVALRLVDAPQGGFASVILLSAVLGLLGGGLGLFLIGPRDPIMVGERPEPNRPKLRGASSLVDPGVLLASALLLCFNLPHPAVTGFLVLYARELGIHDIGWYFVVSGLTNVVTRPLLGRWSDRVGRGLTLAAAFILEILSLLLLVAASSLIVVILSGILYAVGTAVGISTIMALAIDRADPQRRGVAMATFSIAFPLSVGLGAVLAGAVADLAGYRVMYLAVAGLAASGLLALALNWANLHRQTEGPLPHK